MCYIEVKSASYDAANNQAIIEGIDLDNVILQDWDQEFSDKPIEFRFDLGSKGPRIYLYKLLRSVVKENCSSLADMISKMPGKITSISSNFLAKAEG